MNHYPQHIGDWVTDTVHLTAVEEGIYLRLTMQYYKREAPLPADVQACCKLARANSKDERDAVQACLSEFFELRADGYYQKRCDQEIAKYEGRADQARRVGKLGGRPRQSQPDAPRETKPERFSTETETVIRDNQDGFSQEPERFSTETQRKPNHQPITNNQRKEGGAHAPAPWIPDGVWADFVAHRKAKRAPMTKRAVELIVKKLDDYRKHGTSPKTVVEYAIEHGHTGLFYKPDGRVNGHVGKAAWLELRNCIRSNTQPSDPKTVAILAKWGGLATLGMKTSRDLDFMEKDFLAEYGS